MLRGSFGKCQGAGVLKKSFGRIQSRSIKQRQAGIKSRNLILKTWYGRTVDRVHLKP
jgi:hypothetical protein